MITLSDIQLETKTIEGIVQKWSTEDSGIDEKLSEIAQLDGCYVIKSDVPKEIVPKETIHQRYKDPAYVESIFRDMKTYLYLYIYQSIFCRPFPL